MGAELWVAYTRWSLSACKHSNSSLVSCRLEMVLAHQLMFSQDWKTFRGKAKCSWWRDRSPFFMALEGDPISIPRRKEA